jgi:four helix bundle protein
MSNQFNFEKLLVYQKTLGYIDKVDSITQNFPPHELYSLTSQLRRASNSIALNIGEGSAGTINEFKYFLRISSRSLNECIVCITLAQRRKYISIEKEEEMRLLLEEIIKMLIGLRKSLNK